MNTQQMKAMNAVLATGDLNAINAVWKAVAPLPPSPAEGAIAPHRQPAGVAAPPAAAPAAPAPAAPKKTKKAPKEKAAHAAAAAAAAAAPSGLQQMWAESVPIPGLAALGVDDADAEGVDAKKRGAGGKAKKEKAHNKPPEYKKPTKKALKDAKPPAKLKAFQAYMIVQTAELPKQGVTWAAPGDRMKDLAARWKDLEDEEKEVYKEKALELDEQRHEEWMAKQ